MPSYVRVPKGRKTKLTDELTEKICKSMRMGSFIETAAAYAGVHKETLYEWLRKGAAKPKSIYGKFTDQVDAAWAEASLRDLTVIDLCAVGRKATYLKDKDGNLILDKHGDPICEQPALKPDWTASAFRLSRREKSKWGSGRIQDAKPDSEDPTHAPSEVVIDVTPVTPTKVIVQLPDNGRAVPDDEL